MGNGYGYADKKLKSQIPSVCLAILKQDSRTQLMGDLWLNQPCLEFKHAPSTRYSLKQLVQYLLYYVKLWPVATT